MYEKYMELAQDHFLIAYLTKLKMKNKFNWSWCVQNSLTIYRHKQHCKNIYLGNKQQHHFQVQYNFMSTCSHTTDKTLPLTKLLYIILRVFLEKKHITVSNKCYSSYYDLHFNTCNYLMLVWWVIFKKYKVWFESSRKAEVTIWLQHGCPSKTDN
jgi:hypothetical protein